jgi:phenylalanine-4-hydroxylase
VERVMRTHYRIDDFQEIYFVAAANPCFAVSFSCLSMVV